MNEFEVIQRLYHLADHTERPLVADASRLLAAAVRDILFAARDWKHTGEMGSVDLTRLCAELRRLHPVALKYAMVLPDPDDEDAVKQLVLGFAAGMICSLKEGIAA